MFEKNLNEGILLDFYGELLPARKREILELYYNEDFSLSEIAEQIGISRQGVHDIIKKTEAELNFLEEKLGVAKRFRELQQRADRINELLGQYSVPEPLRREWEEFTKSVK